MRSSVLAALCVLVMIGIAVGLSISYEKAVSGKPPRSRRRYDQVFSAVVAALMLAGVIVLAWSLIQDWRMGKPVRAVYVIGLMGMLASIGIGLYTTNRPHGEKEFLKNYEHDPSHCGRCGYNLTGNTSGVCPECGWRLPEPKKVSG